MRLLQGFFIFAAILFALFTATAAEAAYNGRVEVGSDTVIPGGKGYVPVYLYDNDAALLALTVPLKYNSSDLAIDSVSFAGALLKPNMDGLVRIVPESSLVRFTYAPSSGVPMITETQGLLARIFFTVDPTAFQQSIVIDSVNEVVYYGDLALWTRIEFADTSLGESLFPIFSPGNVLVLGPTDADEGDDGLPHVLELKQNYPNPFNPSTRIGFSLPERAKVSLRIYNILGQEIETLVDSYLPAGDYEYIWNAYQSASGIYFYRLAFQDKVLTKKMTLLK